MPEPLITVVLGPTAIGKTQYAINLAKKTNAHIISADAFQIYKNLNIGTGKPSLEEQQGIPHHLIDIKDLDESYSVADFCNQAKIIAENLTQKNTPVIICGGTGLYLKAFLYQFDFSNEAPHKSIRDAVQNQLETKGIAALWTQLNSIDPEYCKKISPNDTKRITRGLEKYLSTNKLPSEARAHTQQREDVRLIGLTAPRETVRARIDQRIDLMMQMGWTEEVEFLLKKGFKKGYQSFEALGYSEIVEYLQDRIGYNEMLECIKTKTKQFAKRQMTWFRRFNYVEWTEIL